VLRVGLLCAAAAFGVLAALLGVGGFAFAAAIGVRRT
jgi:hypothetical protein